MFDDRLSAVRSFYMIHPPLDECSFCLSLSRDGGALVAEEVSSDTSPRVLGPRPHIVVSNFFESSGTNP